MLARQEAARQSALLIAHLEQPNIALRALRPRAFPLVIDAFWCSNSGEYERSTGPSLTITVLGAS